MPPWVASELASRMAISRFCGSFPEPVSKLMSSNSCARNSKSLPVSRDKFRHYFRSHGIDVRHLSTLTSPRRHRGIKVLGEGRERDRPPARSERAFQGSERGEYNSRLQWVSRGTFRGELSADRSIR